KQETDSLADVIGWSRILADVEGSTTKILQQQTENPTKELEISWWQTWLGWKLLFGHVPGRKFGWVLTAVAVSLGAPFWFDVLNKFMVIRSTVKPYEKSPAEGSQDRPGGVPAADRLAPQPSPAPSVAVNQQDRARPADRPVGSTAN